MHCSSWVVAPRGPLKLGVDYLGILVAILGTFATLLLAMQLYNVFSLKEDAKKVADAKNIIEKYAQEYVAELNKITNKYNNPIIGNNEQFN